MRFQNYVLVTLAFFFAGVAQAADCPKTFYFAVEAAKNATVTVTLDNKTQFTAKSNGRVAVFDIPRAQLGARVQATISISGKPDRKTPLGLVVSEPAKQGQCLGKSPKERLTLNQR